MDERTKEYWYGQIVYLQELTATCNFITCEDCIKRFGHCRKNKEIGKFSRLIELADLPNK